MEGLSKGILLQRMEEEYNSLLSTASSSLASSGSNSKRVEFQDSSSVRVPHQVYTYIHDFFAHHYLIVVGYC